MQAGGQDHCGSPARGLAGGRPSVTVANCEPGGAGLLYRTDPTPGIAVLPHRLQPSRRRTRAFPRSCAPGQLLTTPRTPPLNSHFRLNTLTLVPFASSSSQSEYSKLKLSRSRAEPWEWIE